MPIIVACKCGQSFQTKDEYLGKTGRCPSCGQPIQIQPAATPFASAATVMPPAPPPEEPVNKRAAAVLEAREKQAEADKRFLIKMGVVFAGVLTIVAIGYGLSLAMSGGAKSEAVKVDAPKKTETPPTQPAKTEDPKQPAPPVATQPAQPPAKQVPDYSSFQVKDDIDRYILLALQTRDRQTRMNAKIFRPDEPLLDFEPEDRPTPPTAYETVKKLLDRLGGRTDLDLGPLESPETDLIEARMLLNTELVGDGGWVGTQAGRNNFLVFTATPTLRMAQATEKYGKPAKSLKSGDFTLHYYGRVVLLENADGSLAGVTRKITRIAKLAEPAK